MPLVGPPKANRIQVEDQTKRGSKTHHEEKQQWFPVSLARTRVTGAPPPGARPGGRARGRASGGRAFPHGARPGTACRGNVGPPSSELTICRRGHGGRVLCETGGG